MRTEWQCPRCFTPLLARMEEGVELDICDRCAGIWFDAGELAKLGGSRPGLLTGLEHRVQPGSADTGADRAGVLGGRLCPVCRVHMDGFEYPWAPGVHLDGCARCRGVWVDDGELSRIESFAFRARRQQAAAQRPGPVAAMRALVLEGEG